MSDLFVVILVLCGVLNGSVLVARLVPGLKTGEILGGGAVTGTVGLAWLGLVSILAGGEQGRVIGVTIWLVISILAALNLARKWWAAASSAPDSQMGRWPQIEWWKQWWRHRIEEILRRRVELAVNGLWYAGWAGLGALILSRVIGIDEVGGGGLVTSPATNFGDLPFHLSVISSFAFGENLPPENPIFAGQPFTYPFLIDFLTAFLIRAGAGWSTAFLVVNAVLATALLLIIESLGERLTGSRRAGRIAMLLLVGSGGLGFLKFWQELRLFMASVAGMKLGLVGFLLDLPETYTINNSLTLAGAEIPLRYGNLITTLLIPQRSLLFGLPLAGMVVLLWRRGLMVMEGLGERRAMLLAGILTGLLPLAHAHGYLAIMLAASGLCLLHWRRSWLDFFLPAILIAAPAAIWLSGTKVRGSLFRRHLWWEAGTTNPILFWLANNGPFLIVLGIVWGLLWWRRRDVARFYLPFWLWLVIPNLVLLAPWPWDNIKMLVYWNLVSSPLVGLGVGWLLDRGGWRRLAGGGLLLVLILSGAIDIWRGLSPVERVPVLTGEEVAIARRIRETTPPRALILQAAIHNSPLILTGRRTLMGYPGHLWSHGIDYAERETELRRMLAFGPGAEELLARYGIDYVLIGENERLRFEANEDAFRSRYPLVFDESGVRLYQIARN